MYTPSGRKREFCICLSPPDNRAGADRFLNVSKSSAGAGSFLIVTDRAGVPNAADAGERRMSVLDPKAYFHTPRVRERGEENKNIIKWRNPTAYAGTPNARKLTSGNPLLRAGSFFLI